MQIAVVGRVRKRRGVRPVGRVPGLMQGACHVQHHRICLCMVKHSKLGDALALASVFGVGMHRFKIAFL